MVGTSCRIMRRRDPALALLIGTSCRSSGRDIGHGPRTGRPAALSPAARRRKGARRTSCATRSRRSCSRSARTPPYVMGQLGHADPKFQLRVYAHMMRRGDDYNARLLRALVEGVHWHRWAPAVSRASTRPTTMRPTTTETPPEQGIREWSQTGSNRPPPACKPRAASILLPYEAVAKTPPVTQHRCAVGERRCLRSRFGAELPLAACLTALGGVGCPAVATSTSRWGICATASYSLSRDRQSSTQNTERPA
jgi:hypothetical protein